MIKVNLLPHKKLKPIEKGLAKLKAALIAVTVALFVILAIWFYLLNSKLRTLTAKNEEMTKQMDVLKEKLKDVAGYESSRVEYEEKLKLISDLQQQKTPYSTLLSEINRSMSRALWISSLTVADGNVSIDCMAKEDKKYIDDFVAGLRNSTLLTDVALSDVKDSTLGGPSVKTFSFKVTAKVAGYKAVTEEPVVKAKKTKGGKAKAKGGKPAPAPAPAPK